MKRLHKALKRIVMMYWQEEKNHWESLDNPEDHIFMSLNKVKNYIIGKEKEAKDEENE
jgi:hypothetical protein